MLVMSMEEMPQTPRKTYLPPADYGRCHTTSLQQHSVRCACHVG